MPSSVQVNATVWPVLSAATWLWKPPRKARRMPFSASPVSFFDRYRTRTSVTLFGLVTPTTLPLRSSFDLTSGWATRPISATELARPPTRRVCWPLLMAMSDPATPPSAKSTEPAAIPCWSRASPAKATISTSRPRFFHVPRSSAT